MVPFLGDMLDFGGCDCVSVFAPFVAFDSQLQMLPTDRSMGMFFSRCGGLRGGFWNSLRSLNGRDESCLLSFFSSADWFGTAKIVYVCVCVCVKNLLEHHGGIKSTSGCEYVQQNLRSRFLTSLWPYWYWWEEFPVGVLEVSLIPSCGQCIWYVRSIIPDWVWANTRISEIHGVECLILVLEHWNH